MFGSGKTAFAVREMARNLDRRMNYSNIQTGLKNQIDIKPEMIVKKEIVDHKVNKKTGEETPVYKYVMNDKFWKKIKEPINVVIDEAHIILNARKSQSTVNNIVSDWIALIRRVLGSTESGYGELTLISQLLHRIDKNARELATIVVYVICHYLKTCEACGTTWQENSEMPEGYVLCPQCQDNVIFKHSHRVECWHFANIQLYQMWKQFGAKSYYKWYIINDIEDYFPLYNTLQWDNMFSNLY